MLGDNRDPSDDSREFGAVSGELFVGKVIATFGITVGFGALFSWAYISRYRDQSLQERLTFDPTAHSLRGLFLAIRPPALATTPGCWWRG